jgi:hypothetical protein
MYAQTAMQQHIVLCRKLNSDNKSYLYRHAPSIYLVSDPWCFASCTGKNHFFEQCFITQG